MTSLVLILAVVAVMAGALLQGSVGVGLGILAAPILALLVPEAVPGPMLAGAFLLSVLVVIRDRRDLDLRGASLALLGRGPGTLVGVALLTLLAGSPWLEVTLGGLLLVCVLSAALKGKLEVAPRRTWVITAGLFSGISGTAAGVGGPPVALVWSSLPTRRLRSTLAAYFLVGTGFSMLVLLLAGRFGDGSALFWVLPATTVGFLLSGRLGDRIDGTAAFRGVILLSTISSVTLLVRGAMSL